MIEYTLSWYYKEIVIRPSYSGQEIPIDQKYQQTKLLGQENNRPSYPRKGTLSSLYESLFTPRMRLGILFLFATLCLGYKQYCRCECNLKHMITEIEKCGLCTKEFCLLRDPNLCVVDNDENEGGSKSDIVISCFQIESFKEKVVIYLFVAVVFGMVGNAMYKLYRG